MYAGSGTSVNIRRFYMADPQGSVIGITDASGVLLDSHSYSAFGMPDGWGADATGNPLRYTARRWDAESGLYYYRARYYSPALGRFLTTDPIGYGDGLNVYAYVGNDPVNFADPSGLLAVAYKQSVDITAYALFGYDTRFGLPKVSNLAPGVGILDAFGTDIPSGNYGAAAFNIASEFPLLKGSKVLNAIADGSRGSKSVVSSGIPSNIADARKLANDLRAASAKSPFTSSGELTQEALQSGRQIKAPNALGNPNIPKGFGKYSTPTFQSPSGNFQVHYYYNPSTKKVFYDLDYKSIFNR